MRYKINQIKLESSNIQVMKDILELLGRETEEECKVREQTNGTISEGQFLLLNESARKVFEGVALS